MALRMGKKSDAALYEKRSRAWTPLFNKNMGHRTKRILRIERKEYQTY